MMVLISFLFGWGDGCSMGWPISVVILLHFCCVPPTSSGELVIVSRDRFVGSVVWLLCMVLFSFMLYYLYYKYMYVIRNIYMFLYYS